MGRHDDEHLRKFLAARSAGDADGMRDAWEDVVVLIYDRIENLVGLTHKGRLDPFEHEDAVQEALLRFTSKLVHTFEGTSMGELVNATKQLCFYACVDVQRQARRHSRVDSLDAGWTGADEDPASPAWEAEGARQALEAEEDERDVEAFKAWALPQLLDSRRAVVERTFAGMPLPEICEELGLSRDNAYQLRSRGLKDLAKLYRQYDA